MNTHSINKGAAGVAFGAVVGTVAGYCSHRFLKWSRVRSAAVAMSVPVVTAIASVASMRHQEEEIRVEGIPFVDLLESHEDMARDNHIQFKWLADPRSREGAVPVFELVREGKRIQWTRAEVTLSPVPREDPSFSNYLASRVKVNQNLTMQLMRLASDSDADYLRRLIEHAHLDESKEWRVTRTPAAGVKVTHPEGHWVEAVWRGPRLYLQGKSKTGELLSVAGTVDRCTEVSLSESYLCTHKIELIAETIDKFFDSALLKNQ